ncbi:MAG: hypothetical protein WCF67_13625 [Chitinophagaceae bacterium]
MRKLHSMLVLFGALCFGTACNKTLSEEDSAAKKRAEEFQAAVLTHKYKISAFYSDKAIDYITSDTEVKSETDLWGYVKEHIKDDENYFGANGTLTVYQKAARIAGNDAETINTGYGIGAKGADVAVTFVDYSYKPLEYKLLEFDNAYFTVYVDGPGGAKLYTKYARVE